MCAQRNEPVDTLADFCRLLSAVADDAFCYWAYNQAGSVLSLGLARAFCFDCAVAIVLCIINATHAFTFTVHDGGEMISDGTRKHSSIHFPFSFSRGSIRFSKKAVALVPFLPCLFLKPVFLFARSRMNFLPGVAWQRVQETLSFSLAHRITSELESATK